jgi:hypothetical protein
VKKFYAEISNVNSCALGVLKASYAIGQCLLSICLEFLAYVLTLVYSFDCGPWRESVRRRYVGGRRYVHLLAKWVAVVAVD